MDIIYTLYGIKILPYVLRKYILALSYDMPISQIKLFFNLKDKIPKVISFKFLFNLIKYNSLAIAKLLHVPRCEILENLNRVKFKFPNLGMYNPNISYIDVYTSTPTTTSSTTSSTTSFAGSTGSTGSANNKVTKIKPIHLLEYIKIDNDYKIINKSAASATISTNSITSTGAATTPTGTINTTDTTSTTSTTSEAGSKAGSSICYINNIVGISIMYKDIYDTNIYYDEDIMALLYDKESHIDDKFVYNCVFNLIYGFEGIKFMIFVIYKDIEYNIFAIPLLAKN